MLHHCLLFLLLLACVDGQSASTVTPSITLPWNTYYASPLPHASGDAEIWKFQNVRFGETPTGAMRFGTPSTPTKTGSMVDPTGNIRCWNYHKSSNKPSLGDPYLGTPGPSEESTSETEDCLFLDIYVPASVFQNGPPSPKIPVIVWFYGGAYIVGSKDLAVSEGNDILYTGVGAINAAKAFGKDVIFVGGNYRLGAFGWLAGSYMEKTATPNAGFYDQALLLQWVQEYIGQVGGNRSQVSAWGESAGAGSILHHLIRENGQTDPLFKKAVLQSPAFEWQWDRQGTLNDTYTTFADLAGCPKADISCLRDLPLDDPVLTTANQKLLDETFGKTGLFPLGPSVDGTFVQQLPVISFASGKYWTGIQSLIVSHVLDEASIFVPKWIKTQADFTSFVSDFMPQTTLSSVRAAIATQYPADAYGGDARSRAAAVIQDSTFTCNTRQLFDAYQPKNPTYMMEYAVGAIFHAAVHGTDLAPTFWNADVDFVQWLIDAAALLNRTIPLPEAKLIANFFGAKGHFASHYQSYLVSHAVNDGDPNKGSFTKVKWPTATPTGALVGNVLRAHIPSFPRIRQFFLTTDQINTAKACDFWKNLAKEVDAPLAAVPFPLLTAQ